MYIHKQLCIGVRVRVHIYELKNLELTLSKNEQRKIKKNSERLLRSNKITIAAKQSRQVVAAERATRIERETERMRATRVMALDVTTSDLVGIWKRGGECIAQSIQWKSVCDWCASLFLCHTQYECYTKCIFQTILTHSINLRRGETRRCDARRRERREEER